MKATLVFLLAFSLSLSFFSIVHAQTVTPVYTDSFLGSQINSDFWLSGGTATQANTALNVTGNGTFATNGVVSNVAYARTSGDLVFETDISVSDCSATGTTAVFGYGDVDPFYSTSGDYVAAVTNGALNLQVFQNGAAVQQVPTAYSCTSGVPFDVKLVALKAGGALLFVNGSSTPAAVTTGGTFPSKQVFLQEYEPGVTASFSNFNFSFSGNAPTVTGTGISGTTGASNGNSGATTVGGSHLVAGSGISPNPNSPVAVVDPATIIGVSGAAPDTTSNTAGSASTANTAATQPTTPPGATGVIPCGYGTNTDGNNGGMCEFDDLVKLAKNVINVLITLSVVVATISFAYAGYLYLTSAGDMGQVKKATGIFTNVAFGFIIVIAAWLIVHTILNALLGSAANPIQ